MFPLLRRPQDLNPRADRVRRPWQGSAHVQVTASPEREEGGQGDREEDNGHGTDGYGTQGQNHGASCGRQ